LLRNAWTFSLLILLILGPISFRLQLDVLEETAEPSLCTKRGGAKSNKPMDRPVSTIEGQQFPEMGYCSALIVEQDDYDDETMPTWALLNLEQSKKSPTIEQPMPMVRPLVPHQPASKITHCENKLRAMPLSVA
jgi:hypothetical protein